MANSAITLSKVQARRVWLRAQKLDSHAPFGNGPQATPAAVQHLGYVQIDTINVIERCHHHILYTRIPEYRREHLRQAQTIDKTVFETGDTRSPTSRPRTFRFHVRDMRSYTARAHPWLKGTSDQVVRAMVARIRRNGALTIRDIEEEGGGEDTRLGQPQAVEAGAANCVQQGSAHDQRAHRDVENLRAHHAALWVAALAARGACE